jgi:hypothetical protein
MINPTAYQPNIQQPIAAGQNMQMNMGAEDQKILRVIYIYIINYLINLFI